MTLALAWAATAGAAAVLAYRWRRRVLPLCLLVLATAATLGATVVLTGDVAPDLFMRAARIAVATVILSGLTVLLVVHGLPQLVSRRDRRGALVVSAMLAGMYTAVAVFLAVVADTGMRVDRVPVLHDRDDFIASRDAPHDPAGVLLPGTISEHTAALEPPHDVVASHPCLRIGSQEFPLPGGRLPERYLVDFPGGLPIVVDGITSGTRAWDWPSRGAEGAGTCVLRRGDSVVVWGQLVQGLGGGATSYTGLADVRVIAGGDVSAFLDHYAPAAERTARAVLGLAFLNGALAVTVAILGVRTYRRLTRTGTDAPPRITWHTGGR